MDDNNDITASIFGNNDSFLDSTKKISPTTTNNNNTKKNTINNFNFEEDHFGGGDNNNNNNNNNNNVVNSIFQDDTFGGDNNNNNNYNNNFNNDNNFNNYDNNYDNNYENNNNNFNNNYNDNYNNNYNDNYNNNNSNNYNHNYSNNNNYNNNYNDNNNNYNNNYNDNRNYSDNSNNYNNNNNNNNNYHDNNYNHNDNSNNYNNNNSYHDNSNYSNSYNDNNNYNNFSDNNNNNNNYNDNYNNNNNMNNHQFNNNSDNFNNNSNNNIQINNNNNNNNNSNNNIINNYNEINYHNQYQQRNQKDELEHQEFENELRRKEEEYLQNPNNSTMINVSGVLVPEDIYEKRVEKWKNDFKTIFRNLETLDIDFSKASFGLPKDTTVRGIFWRIALGTLPKDPSTWIERTNSCRKKYETFKKNYIINPRNNENKTIQINDDPLSQSEDSLWNQFFDNESAQKEISHDISRTYPGISFFERSEIQEIMIRILFIFSKQYPKIKYLQGMNEILAPILYSVYNDSHWFNNRDVFSKKNYDKKNKSHHGDQFSYVFDNSAEREYYPSGPIPYPTNDSHSSKRDGGLGSFLRDPQYFEHDSYFIFESLMATISKWFTSPPSSPQPPPRVQGKYKELYDLSERDASDQAVNIIVVEQCLRMFEDLKFIEPQLYTYLKDDLGIEPHLYSLRWIRIMLAQVFPLDSLLILWDSIFKESITEFLPYICITMLVMIKDQIFQRDYSECLQVLFHYPVSQDMPLLLNTTYNIRDKISMARQQYNLPISTPISTPLQTTLSRRSQTIKSTSSASLATSSSSHSSTTYKSSNNSYSNSNRSSTSYSNNSTSKNSSQSYNSGGSIFSTFTSTFKQIINDFNEYNEESELMKENQQLKNSKQQLQKEIDSLKETQTHVVSRLERMLFSFNDFKQKHIGDDQDSFESIDAMEKEINSILVEVLNTNNDINVNKNLKKSNLSNSVPTPKINNSPITTLNNNNNNTTNNTPTTIAAISTSSNIVQQQQPSPKSTLQQEQINNSNNNLKYYNNNFNDNNNSNSNEYNNSPFQQYQNENRPQDFNNNQDDINQFVQVQSDKKEFQLVTLSLPNIPVTEDDLVEITTDDTTFDDDDNEIIKQINYKKQMESKWSSFN